ncbi:hypothetical protein NJC11_29710 [Pseudomonas aeruginosa]|jgi:hypothetical protein|nr:hypothetical protein [Pseudomonas aeruginosa]MCO7655677.1 hypothetical protein [Pseudomonas aeruginosa]
MSRQSSSSAEILLGLLFGALLSLAMFIYKLYTHQPEPQATEGDDE